MCYRDRLVVDKQELLALRWATDFLIPSVTLVDVLAKRIVNTLSELEDYFFVTREFLMKKFEFMSRKSPVWKVGSRQLCLHSLPSVYILDTIN